MVLSQRQILGTGNLPQDSAKTKHFVSPHLIGPQFLANQYETNQHKSAAMIGLFHATSSVLLSVESYRNYQKLTQRGVQGYLSSLQWRVYIYIKYECSKYLWLMCVYYIVLLNQAHILFIYFSPLNLTKIEKTLMLK